MREKTPFQQISSTLILKKKFRQKLDKEQSECFINKGAWGAALKKVTGVFRAILLKSLLNIGSVDFLSLILEAITDW